MDENVAAEVERLEDLVHEPGSEDRFERLTAYAVIVILTDELKEIAKTGGYPSGNIGQILHDIRFHAAALAGAAKLDRSEEDLRSFCLQDISRLDMPTCFGRSR